MTNEDWEKRNQEDRESDYRGRGFAGIILLVPTMLAIDYWALERPFWLSVAYSLVLALALVVPLTLMELGQINVELRIGQGRLRKFIVARQTAIQMIITGGFFYYTIGASVRDFYVYLAGPHSGRLTVVLVTILFTLIAGGGLFYFRLKRRALYGATEIIIGVVVASFRVTDSTSSTYFQPEFVLVILTAGVYLVVRGMDNIHQAIKSSEKIKPPLKYDDSQKEL